MHVFLIMVKLLLTSSGISNPGIQNALTALLGKPIAECKALFVPTGVYPFPNGAYYAQRAISGTIASPLAQLGWLSLGVLELTALPSIDEKVWQPTIEEADAILVWGGDPLYLAYWLEESGLNAFLRSLGKDIVYVGVSAGAIATARIFAETYSNPPAGKHYALNKENIAFETSQGIVSRTLVTANGAGLVNFAVIPHYQNPDFADACEPNASTWASKIPAPVYAIDEQSAIVVSDGKTEIVSEGDWKLFH